MKSLKHLKSWKESSKNNLAWIDIVVFHNARATSAKSLSSEVYELISDLDATLYIGNKPFEGAELSFRQALSFIKSGYVLALTDDNLFLYDAMDAVVDLVNNEIFDWVHFNSITNSNSNFLVSTSFYECESTELINRIGVNFSLCCISRSLFRIEEIDFALWDELIFNKQSVFSFAVVLAISFNKKRVALCQLPIENRTTHNYDTSILSWARQWKAHAELNSDGYLYPFTVHLSALHEKLVGAEVIDKDKMDFMVVMEANQLRPLYVEMTNLSFIHAYSLVTENIDLTQFFQHLNRLKKFFPLLTDTYEDIRQALRAEKKFIRNKMLVSAENQYRTLIGTDNFKQSKLFGDSFTNLIKHPKGEMLPVVLSIDEDWRSSFFVFSESNRKMSVKEGKDPKDLHLRFDIVNDPFFKLTRSGSGNFNALRLSGFFPLPILLLGKKCLPNNVKRLIVRIIRKFEI